MTEEHIANLTRSHHIMLLYTKLVDTVFKVRQENKLSKMAELVRENQIIKGGTACFQFEGIWYTDPHTGTMPADKTGMNKLLDVSIRHKAYQILYDQDWEADMQDSYIKHYFKYILQTCKTTDCLLSLLPHSLHLIGIDPKVFNIGEPLTTKKREKLEIQVAKGKEALSILFMHDLLSIKIGK